MGMNLLAVVRTIYVGFVLILRENRLAAGWIGHVIGFRS